MDIVVCSPLLFKGWLIPSAELVKYPVEDDNISPSIHPHLHQFDTKSVKNDTLPPEEHKKAKRTGRVTSRTPQTLRSP